MSIFPFGNTMGRGLTLVTIIDSGSVAAALVHGSNGNYPDIVWSARIPIAYQDDIDFKHFSDATVKSLSDLYTQLQNARLPRPRRFCTVLASPWYVSQTRTVKVSSVKEFEVTKTVVDKIVSDEVSEFEKERVKEHDVILGHENKVIEVKNMKMKLNGYNTNQPYGRRVLELHLSLFISMSSTDILERFTSVVQKFFHSENVEFHTLPYISYNTIRDMFTTEERFIFCDINAEITDLSVVSKRVIAETVSFPLGYNFITRRLSGSRKTVPSEASSTISSYIENELSDSARKKIESDVQFVKSEWLKSMRRVLELSTFEYLLPTTIYVACQPAFLKLFTEFLSEQTLNQFTISNKPFTVVPITSETLSHFFSSTGRTKDTFVMLSALFFTRAHTV